MENSDLTLGRLIELAMEMEKQAFLFYEALEGNFRDKKDFVGCLSGIKEDELMHHRVLVDIKRSLSDTRLASPVTQVSIKRVVDVLQFLEDLNYPELDDEEKAVAAIQTLEAVEFDVVMDFVDADEIDFEFTREFLKNESLDHGNRIFKAQQCLD